MRNSIHLTLTDFTKPWWRVIAAQKKLALIVICATILSNAFWATVPFLITFILEQGSVYFFGGICVLWLLIEFNSILQVPNNAKFQLQCIYSVFYSAHQHLLTIDPQYHTKRSSGVILAKIDRDSRGYEEILDQITYEFAPLVIGIITMVIILSHYSLLLVLAICSCLTAMICFGYYFAKNAGKISKSRRLCFYNQG